MTRDELMRLLDLNAKPAARKKLEDTLDNIQPEDPQLTAEEEAELEGADTVFNCDEWELAHGERLTCEVPTVEETHLADLFAAAYRQYPEVTRNCGDPQFQQFVDTLVESSDFNVLHESTRSNILASDMAAVQFARQFAELERKEDEHQQLVLAGRASAHSPGKTEAACLCAVGRALQAAQEEVEALEEMENCLGMGGNGATDKSMDAAKVARLFQRVRNNPQLKRICELAGRYRRIAQSKQRQKTTHGYDDMVGVEMSGDVGRLLPLELALLADEDFELDAMRRLVENQAMSRQFRGVEKQAKGPVIVVVDESGSMGVNDREPVSNAKAFALAMAWIANHQGRWCGLVSYSGGTQGYILALPPGKWNQEKLTDWLAHFYGGGTEMDVPLRELPERYWKELGAPRGKTDVILITDAICSVPDKMRDEFNAWKQAEKVRCISLIVGQRDAGGLKDVSDEVHLVSTITTEDEGVQSCFSL